MGSNSKEEYQGSEQIIGTDCISGDMEATCNVEPVPVLRRRPKEATKSCKMQWRDLSFIVLVTMLVCHSVTAATVIICQSQATSLGLNIPSPTRESPA